METEYLECGTPLPRYLPLPIFLLDMDISSTSKILFALLLNRANLSHKNFWKDEKGHVYCIYTIEEMANDMHKSKTAIKSALNELSKNGLLERIRAEFGRANHLYIKIPAGADTVRKPSVIRSENEPSVGRKTVPDKVRYPATNNYIKTQNENNPKEKRLWDYSYEEGGSL